MKNLSMASLTCVVALFCITTAVASPAQTYKVVFDFNGANGQGTNDGQSSGILVQGLDGNLYGTAGGGKFHDGFGYGTAFRLTPAGALTQLYQFCSLAKCADGEYPGTLTLAPNGNFYGTTNEGGTGKNNGCGATDICGGTFFELTPVGTLTTLYDFCSDKHCANGSNPWGFTGPVPGTDGKLYGTTFQGGSSNCPYGCGTVFDVTTTGKLETFYALCAETDCSEGGAGSLILGTDGDFYASWLNWEGEPPEPGLIFQLTPTASYSTVYELSNSTNECCADNLIQGTDGNLYGLSGPGANDGGTFFKLTPSGEFTTLYSFCSQTNCTDGDAPNSLVEGTDGNFYGTTIFGGANTGKPCEPYGGCGTIFKITPAGEETVLYNFCSKANCADGADPGNLMQATDGSFYGITEVGGTPEKCYLKKGCGVIFKVSVGLGAFVEANPSFGAIGQAVNLLGNKLEGTTSVTFNGVAATFTVKSDTYIEAKVPSGATSGTIEVTTPSGTLNSNVAFQVLP
jgi:uncharacterized repeat protein (TIGR03803 family)